MLLFYPLFYPTQVNFIKKSASKPFYTKINTTFVQLLEAETGSAEEQPARNRVVTDEQNAIFFQRYIF